MENQTKNTSVLTNQTKNTSTWDLGSNFLLKEDEYYLLLETGDKIVLTVSKNTSQFTNQSKN